MSKILIFAFNNTQAEGGLDDLQCVLETDNRQAHPVVDASGMLLPTEVVILAQRYNLPGRLQVLHLDNSGLPARAEVWQRVPLHHLEGGSTDMLVEVGERCSYLQVRSGACRWGIR